MSKITDDRLAEVVDGRSQASEWEVRVAFAELLAHRAGDHQREREYAARQSAQGILGEQDDRR